jgi:C-terminal processing protease CtpA/Prc
MHRQWFSLLALVGLGLGAAAAVADDRDDQDQGQKKQQTQAQRPSLGLMVNSLPDEEGVVIRRVYPDSPAAKAGLRRGDVITRVDSREVGDADTLINILARHKPGDKLRFHVLRNDQERDLSVTLGQTSSRTQTAQEQEQGTDERGERATGQSATAFLGVQAVPIDDLSDRMRKRLGVQGEEGIVVVEVLPNSPAAKAGLQHGDVIQNVNKQEVTSQEALRRAVQQTGVGKSVTLKVQRGDQKMNLHAKLEAAPWHIGMFPEMGQEGPAGFFSRRAGYGAEEQRQIERLERHIQRLERRINQLEEKLNQKQKGRGSEE